MLYFLSGFFGLRISTKNRLVCLILVHMKLKETDNNLTTAYIRTDNAGCYKGSDILLTVKQIRKLTGVFIRRFDCSDAQSGKGPCDRMAAVIKANIRDSSMKRTVVLPAQTLSMHPRLLNTQLSEHAAWLSRLFQ